MGGGGGGGGGGLGWGRVGCGRGRLDGGGGARRVLAHIGGGLFAVHCPGLPVDLILVFHVPAVEFELKDGDAPLHVLLRLGKNGLLPGHPRVRQGNVPGLLQRDGSGHGNAVPRPHHRLLLLLHHRAVGGVDLVFVLRLSGQELHLVHKGPLVPLILHLDGLGGSGIHPRVGKGEVLGRLPADGGALLRSPRPVGDHHDTHAGGHQNDAETGHRQRGPFGGGKHLLEA